MKTKKTKLRKISLPFTATVRPGNGKRSIGIVTIPLERLRDIGAEIGTRILIVGVEVYE